MNTQQLQQYMLMDPYIRQYYGGVISSDQLPLVVKKPTVYIVNTDPSWLPGEHWVTFFMDTVCEQFDSSGIAPRKEFETFLIAYGPNYKFNTKRVQDYDTDTCGLYCLMYAYFRCRGYSFDDFINMFKDNLSVNEIIVKYFYSNTS